MVFPNRTKERAPPTNLTHQKQKQTPKEKPAHLAVAGCGQKLITKMRIT
jgi:hypothetical protein